MHLCTTGVKTKSHSSENTWLPHGPLCHTCPSDNVVHRSVGYSRYVMESGNLEYAGSSWLCRTGGKPDQSLWELRVLVDAGRIHLLLGEIFCTHKLRFMERIPPKVDSLEVSSPEVGSLEVGQDLGRLPQILRRKSRRE
jgi:hypothetical protein